MATLYGANKTLADVNIPSEKIPAGEQVGQKHFAYDEYALVGVVLANADVIKMMKLPAGARVSNVSIAFPDMGATGSCNVGWEASASGAIVADPDGFLAAVDLNTAADCISMKEQANMPGQYKKFDEEVQVSIVMTAASTATSGTIKLEVEYILI